MRKPLPPLRRSSCCGANVMLLELRSAGSPSREGWPHMTGKVYERDEKLLCCGECGRQWTEPRVLIKRPDGSCVEG